MSGVTGSGVSDVAPAPVQDSFLATAQLLADPERLAAEYQKLAAARAEVLALTDLVGPAEEILRMHEQARLELAEAQAATKVAREAADASVSEAKAIADQAVAEAKEYAHGLISEAEKAKAAADEAQVAADQMMEAARDLEVEVNARLADERERLGHLETDMLASKADAEKQFKDYYDRAAKLQAVADQIAAALAT